MVLLIIACLAFVAAAFSVRAAIPWLQRQGSVATENERTMHKGIVPKGGGLPLLLSAIVAVALVARPPALDPVMLAGLAALMALSWRDDVAPLSASLRLPVHIAVASLLVLTLPAEARVFQGVLPGWLDAIVAIVALTWTMNLYNFMDGINGLAGAESIAIAAGYLLIGSITATTLPHEALAAGMLGATAGFLIWNCHEKALVFLGDVGSVPLGFLMGVLMIDLAVKGYWAAALILPAYFLADATMTLAMRAARAEKFWEAHKTHFYQRAAQRLGSHLLVVAAVSIANLLLVSAALLSLTAPLQGLAIAAAVTATLLFTLDRAAKPQSSDSG